MKDFTKNQLNIEEITKAINRHGYALQYASLNKFKELFIRKSTKWQFVASEFPVNLINSGLDTRIDYILKNKDFPVYIIIECKRVNPAFSNWGFIKVPFVHRKYSRDKFIIDSLNKKNDSIKINAQQSIIFYDDYFFNIGLEFKSNNRGDSFGSKDSIEKASTQVCKGSNGFIETLYKNIGLLINGSSPKSTKLIIIPIIITTANLFSINVNLTDANIENGNVTQDQVKIKEINYVYYQYHQSEGIRQGYINEINDYPDIPKVFEQKYIRTIPIVSSKNIEIFFSDFDFDLDDFYDI